jgi:hypothetical protein
MRIATVLMLVAAGAFGCSGGPDAGGLHVPIPDGGEIFPNLELQGLRSAAASDDLVPVSTWEYYDPNGQQYDLLHVMVICMWCPHCNKEATDVSKIVAWQSQHRVASLQIAIQGYTGKAPTLAELKQWSADHTLTFPLLVDAQGAQLGRYFPVDSVPVNIAVNPRTMAVLGIDVGEVGAVQSYEQGFLDQLLPTGP